MFDCIERKRKNSRSMRLPIDASYAFCQFMPFAEDLPLYLELIQVGEVVVILE